jgi:transcriptional regulator with XRE-family HTH domain
MAASKTDSKVTLISPLVAQREYLGMTRQQLSERSGVSISTIRDYETGKRRLGRMRIRTAVALFDTLCLSLGVVSWLD